MGLGAGTIILFLSSGTSSHILRFVEELFFIYLLPPIIFNAGFQVKKKQFFRNFTTIILHGVLGCILSSCIIALAIGVIFSSADTVSTLQVLNQDETPLLYSLVFGEGVINDATSVVLLRATQKPSTRSATSNVVVDFFYLFSTSTVLGVAVGLLTAYALRKLYLAKHSTDREVTLMVFTAYLSYMLAEITRHVFATLSYIAETFIFLYVGMDALDSEKWLMSELSFGTSLGVYSTLIFLILLGRAVLVILGSAISNVFNKMYGSPRITYKDQVIIWWAGLMRGAVSIALAFSQYTHSGVPWDSVRATMVTNTIIVVVFTTLVLGAFTKSLIKLLVPQHVLDTPSLQDQTPSLEELNLPLLSFKESAKTNT
ncbi:hypothetical protein IFM89_037278 [Coptis chinensis]|uniref:Cation/H+ exchanger transmembrane domain-containing protein n=1 Tax=Coptis chinensis TaxID=261450 RepID=A0A835LY99_9MAGN|nr:hypothetical protein IFM89_037278 [Coptis chinensis]